MADVVDKSKQTSGVPLFHRVVAGAVDLSIALTLPSATRSVSVHAVGAAARLFFDAADETANTGYFEVPAGVPVTVPIRTDRLIVQARGAAVICVVTTHDALAPADANGVEYVAA